MFCSDLWEFTSFIIWREKMGSPAGATLPVTNIDPASILVRSLRKSVISWCALLPSQWDTHSASGRLLGSYERDPYCWINNMFVSLPRTIGCCWRFRHVISGCNQRNVQQYIHIVPINTFCREYSWSYLRQHSSTAVQQYSSNGEVSGIILFLTINSGDIFF